MIAIACLLLYMGIVKKFEPLLLVPIAFGMLLTMTGLLLSGDVVALIKANMRGRGK